LIGPPRGINQGFKKWSVRLRDETIYMKVGRQGGRAPGGLLCAQMAQLLAFGAMSAQSQFPYVNHQRWQRATVRRCHATDLYGWLRDISQAR